MMPPPRAIDVTMIAPLPPPVGGIATSTENILACAPAYGVNVNVIDSAVRWRRPTQTAGVRYWVGSVLHGLRLARQVHSAVRQARPTVAHVCTSGGLGFARDFLMLRLLRQQRIPAVLHLHMGRLPAVLQAAGLESKLARTAFREASLVALLDADSRLALLSCEPQVNAVICPNFIDVEHIKGLVAAGSTEDRRNEIVFVGWVIPSKGVQELVDACGLAEGVRLKLIGPVEDTFAAELSHIAQNRGLALELTGAVDKTAVYTAIAQALALALPSYSEGFPYTVLESMALGCPVIATPVGAIPEMLQFGTDTPCGYEVPVRDVVALRDAIREAKTDFARWQQLGQNGERRVSQYYSADAVMPKLVDIWRRAAAGING